MEDNNRSIDLVTEQMLRTYAWAYFAYHADQRMKTFNFFFIGAGFLGGGIATLMRSDGDPRWACPLGIALFFLSLIFLKIDQRNKQLVRNGEAALKFLDQLHAFPKVEKLPHVLSIFERDDAMVEKAERYPLSSGYFSYTKCLGLVYSIFSLLGLVFAIGCFLILYQKRANF